MKLRLLNGTHSAIAYLGQLRDLETVSDAMARPAGRWTFARRLMRQDLRATVAAPDGYDVLGVLRSSCCIASKTRRSRHRTQQIAMDGTQKVPVRWLPGAAREPRTPASSWPIWNVRSPRGCTIC